MTQEEFSQAIQELMSAQSVEEAQTTLARNPELLSEEAIHAVAAFAQELKQRGHEEQANQFLQLAEWLTEARTQMEAAERPDDSPGAVQPIITEPTVVWATLVRKYLALRKREFLAQAVAAAEETGASDVAGVLKDFQAGKLDSALSKAGELSNTFASAGNPEEGITLRLILLDVIAALTEQYIHFPVEQQAELRARGIRACEEAMSLAGLLGDEACRAAYGLAQGNGYARGRQLRKAADAYYEALEIRRRLAAQDPQTYESDVAMTLNNLGNVLRDTDGKLAEAEAAYLEAKKICEESDHSDFVPIATKTLSSLGQIKMRQEAWRDALDIVLQGIGQAKRLYGESYSAERAKQIMEENIALYENQVVCLMKLNQYRDALTAAENGKARSLNDMMRQQTLRRQNVTQAYQPFDETLTAAEAVELAKDSARTFVLFRVTAYGTYIFFIFPDGQIDVLTVGDFTSEKLYELLVTFEDKDAVGGWVVRYYQFLSAYAEADKARVNYSKNQTPENEAAFVHAHDGYQVAKAAWFAEMESVLKKLYEQLMQPVHQRLQQQGIAKDSQIVIIPNRGLGILPLHACWWPDENGEPRYLIDEYIFVYAPNLTIFKECRDKERAGRSSETLLAVANPGGDLKHSEEECRAIESMFGAEHSLVLSGTDATKTRIKENYQQRNCLHFSCHGTYDINAPLDSGLLLAPEQANGQSLPDDGKLRFLEIAQGLDLNHTWLTVLSACETALTEPRALADEYYSLSTAFLIAGTPTVWGTLWSVGDEATKELLVKAYGLLDTTSKPEALRQAQLDLKIQPQYSHPIHWAAMQSFGV